MIPTTAQTPLQQNEPPLSIISAIFSDPAADLAKLGHIIDIELQNCLTHLSSIPKATFASLTTSGNSPQTKVAALGHILETLTIRQKALCNDEIVSLPKDCAALLEGLKNKPEGVDLNGYYDYILFKGKKVKKDIEVIEEEMRALEQGRLEGLKQLMSLYEMLAILGEDGMLGELDVMLLVEAMEAVGVGCEGGGGET